MRGYYLLAKAGILLMAGFTLCFLPMCDDDDDDNNTDDGISKEPVWVYDTQENPYGSAPWVTGANLVVCSRQDDDDLGTIHCVNTASGESIWKMTDSTVTRTSPVVYATLAIYGGYNVHALDISDGSREWDYSDDLVKLNLYSSPLLVPESGHVYVASSLGMLDLIASNGLMNWEIDNIGCLNTGMPAPVFSNGKLYYATVTGTVLRFNATFGVWDWEINFNSALDNAPLVFSDRIYIGLHVPDATTNSLFCMQLDGVTVDWSKKIGQVISNMAAEGTRLYVVGGNTLYSLSAADGTELWKHGMTAGSIATPALAAGKVYIGNGDRFLCLDASTGGGIWHYATADQLGFSTPVISGDKVYVSCEDGKVYCFSL